MQHKLTPQCTNQIANDLGYVVTFSSHALWHYLKVHCQHNICELKKIPTTDKQQANIHILKTYQCTVRTERNKSEQNMRNTQHDWPCGLVFLLKCLLLVLVHFDDLEFKGGREGHDKGTGVALLNGVLYLHQPEGQGRQRSRGQNVNLVLPEQSRFAGDINSTDGLWG